MNKPFPAPNGRPTKEQAEQRHAQLLDRALEMFLEKGFEITTMEAIATSLNMTKRTIYARYKDKHALFRAVVQRAVDQSLLRTEALENTDTGELESTLRAVAELRASHSLSPAGLRLQRIINSESFRFPEILQSYEDSAQPTIQFLADLFRRYEGKEIDKREDPEFDARIFLNIVAAATRIVALGKPVDEAKINARITLGVNMFLNGARTR